MLLSYQECITQYGSDYGIKKAISEGRLFFKEKGLYSTTEHYSELSSIMLKYPKAVLTGKSAFYYHSLTDGIPDYYYLATRRNDTRINDKRVQQSFLKEEMFNAGITTMRYNNSVIRVYDRERMLIELMRFKAKYSLDYYKEVVLNYRKIADTLDFVSVEDYAMMFKNGGTLLNMIQMEVL
jgi:predicted transcriptional regulator of viral defense system